jgi:toxin ParE1/3/4
MAALIWTEPALQDLDAIADYIALDNPRAARELVQRVFQHVEQLQAHPESGSLPPELRRSSRRYRQIVEPPCRSRNIFVLCVMRAEMRLRKSRLFERSRREPKR